MVGSCGRFAGTGNPLGRAGSEWWEPQPSAGRVHREAEAKGEGQMEEDRVSLSRCFGPRCDSAIGDSRKLTG
ncbi:hypothetical protein N7462_004082 [Penicillium macrosclerotiorum]|uniref:uncharacterized protein n=1 Tax=Penicillium macrosclerotiorum TaxID=303699 RepID=UPI0025476516|nr:uncharacterized protein N7462_004082 [Penicillium macrosclerotiorum]KAJ5689690.1 hypothetical protein N7462_004082 [Penicillium macrosclerotiorum]